MKRTALTLVSTLMFLAPLTVLANGGHHGPPPEALEACKGLQEGNACQVSFDGKTTAGTCRTGPQGEAAACLPEGGPGGRGRHHGPPPEALSACSGKAQGATCSFTHRDHTMEGTCEQGPQGDTTACRPARPPERG